MKKHPIHHNVFITDHPIFMYGGEVLETRRYSASLDVMAKLHENTIMFVYEDGSNSSSCRIYITKYAVCGPHPIIPAMKETSSLGKVNGLLNYMDYQYPTNYRYLLIA